MTNYSQFYSTRKTPQSQKIPGSNQTKNNAGGYAYTLNDWNQLSRFLILGSEAPTYYASQQKLTVDNANAVKNCIDNNGVEVVRIIVDVSKNGRAPKNDPALFALAMCVKFGDLETRRAAYNALPEVARIPTHLFNFLEYIKGFKGWSRGLRNAVSRWYQNNNKLAYHLVKYKSRNGWSHRDALRLSHPKPQTELQQELFNYAVNGWDSVGDLPHPNKNLQIVWAVEKAKTVTRESEIINLISDYRLTREMIPTKWLKSVNVWEALLQNMPLTAMIRNLGKMSSIGLLDFCSESVNTVCSRLEDRNYLHKSRIHPLNVLVAMNVYEQGKGIKGTLSWRQSRRIVDSLDSAFYLSFDNVEPTNKRIMIALDVSGSMTRAINGLPLSCRDASAALAMVTARTEKNYMFTMFSSAGTNFSKANYKTRYGGCGISTLAISPRQRLDDIIKSIQGLPFGGTDCALPMLYATQNKINFDAFVLYTDNETWAGEIHAVQALDVYRQKSGNDAKLITVGMISNGFSIADPDRSDMLDVVGFNTSTPNVISQFIGE